MSSDVVPSSVREVRLTSGSIRYRDTGTGKPIVFLHGIVANGDLWREVTPRLSADVRCIAPDWPLGAHAVGMDPQADLSLPGLAALVDEFLEALDLHDVTLVANDTGGAIAQWVAIRHPDRLDSLVLTPCDAFDNFPPLLLRHLHVTGRWAPTVWLLGQALRLRLVQRLPIAFGWLTVRPIDRTAMRSYTRPLATNSAVRHDFAKVVRAMSTRYTWQAARELSTFAKPTLIVWGSDDRLFPLEHAHRLRNAFPDARLTVVDSAGAFITEDRPGEVADAMAAFIAEPVTRQAA